MELRKKILISAFGAATAIVGAVGVNIYGDYNWSIGDGTRSGIVDKFSEKKSNWWSPCASWEGELARDSFSVARGSAPQQRTSNSFAFSAQDDRVIEKLRQAADSREIVNLKYTETKKRIQCFRETNYVVVDVLPIAGPK
jgi:hypothetical protein